MDVLALTGDAVDNVPGVPGIGPKTAAKLVQEFGTVESILQNLDKIKGKRHDNLQASAAFLPTAKKLVTLDYDVPIEFDLADAKVGGIDATSLRRLFKELGFNRHWRKLDRLLDQGKAVASADHSPADVAGTSTESSDNFPATLFDGGTDARAAGSDTTTTAPGLQTAADCDYQAITTRDELAKLVTTLRQQKLVSVDAETIGLGHRTELCGLCFAWKEKAGVYVPIASPNPNQHLDRSTVLRSTYAHP